MAIPTIFDTCQPRQDVLEGTISEADFAADLSRVISGDGAEDYRDPVRFFENTYPTRGLKNLLENVCRRLTGAGGEAAAIFRLDTSYGGGKTHGLIALTHAARGMKRVSNIKEFLDPTLLPKKNKVRVAAFDGENADPANGRKMGDDVLAHTPWGEIAYMLAGKKGFDRIRKSDDTRTAPGAATLRELFDDKPTLILLDELSIYLRKVNDHASGRDQLTAFLTSLFKAVDGTKNAALVYTLAIGQDGRATDAYSDENEFIAERMAEAEAVSARQATLLNPTEDDETVQVLRRRLFERIDEDKIAAVTNAYKKMWDTNQEYLSDVASRSETVENFQASYPLHPEVLHTLTAKTATLNEFQRVRGMLRLLARTIARLWEQQPKDASAIHLHHIDLGYEPIRQEIVTRLGQSRFVPAINNDITSGDASSSGLAASLDIELHRGMPPYAVYIARTIFMHTLAYNEPLKGVSPEQLRYSILSPTMDISFVDEARERFIAESAYLDDRVGIPMQFSAEPNINQMIRQEESHVDLEDVRSELNDRIKEIFKGETLELIPFPGGPYDVSDNESGGHPKLVLINYDAEAVGASSEDVPKLIERIFQYKDADDSALRLLRNDLVFVVADDDRKLGMQRKAKRREALRKMISSDRLADLAAHQQKKVRELEQMSQQHLSIAIQQCYRHVFYPSKHQGTDLAHTAIDLPLSSNLPGVGQLQVVKSLRSLGKLRLPEDQPNSPAYVRDRTPLKNGKITTSALRSEFRRDPALPMLIDNVVFLEGIRQGIQSSEYVYRRGDLLLGPGDPDARIEINEQSFIYTMRHAKDEGIWPRQQPDSSRGGEGSGDGKEGSSEEEDAIEGDSVAEAKPLTAQGPLREALTHLWEKARGRQVEKVSTLTITMFDAVDTFRLLSAVGSVSNADKHLEIKGEYETRNGSQLEMTFQGTVSDAQPVREFLELQLRDAKSKDIETRFDLTFENGLEMHENDAEKLTKQLCKFASGDAFVEAIYEVRA